METPPKNHSPYIEVFAQVAASISHEIKNVLAIINENGGLLEDLAEMSSLDQGVDPERIKKITMTIGRQVARANTIMKDLNRFAHSGDAVIGRDSLVNLLSLVVTLTGRQAAMKNLTVSLHCPDSLHIQTNILALESLVYLLLRKVIDGSNHEATISLSVAESNSGFGVMITAPWLKENEPTGIIASANLQLLTAATQGELSCSGEGLLLSIRDIAA